MTFVIISGEIDLSVASMMGLAAAVAAALYEPGVPMPLAILVALAVGAAIRPAQRLLGRGCRVASLAVTLAGYIGFRGSGASCS